MRKPSKTAILEKAIHDLQKRVRSLEIINDSGLSPSWIEDISYSSNKILSIVFAADKNIVYKYKDVPMILFTEMMQSKWIGKFFNVYIKDKFEFTKEPCN